MEKEIALSLSGGGVRGLAHVGAIRAIEEAGYQIKSMAGCSFGAIVAVTYAAGADWQSLPQVIPAWFTVRNARLGLGQGGLLSTQIVSNLLKYLKLPDRLEDLPIPVTVVATDLVSGAPIYFSKGPLAMIVSASCCLPGLMAPVQWEGMVLIDGGATDVLPTVPLTGQGLPVWAVHTNAYPAGSLPAINTRVVIERLGQLLSHRQVQAKRESIDRLIEPKALGSYRMLDWHLAGQIAEEGYQSVKALTSPSA